MLITCSFRKITEPKEICVYTVEQRRYLMLIEAREEYFDEHVVYENKENYNDIVFFISLIFHYRLGCGNLIRTTSV